MKFTIPQIAYYLAGWATGTFGDIQGKGRGHYHNALNQLRDPQDGIEAVARRTYGPAEILDMESSGKANAIFKAKTWGWQYLRLERLTIQRTDSWASGTLYGVKILFFKFFVNLTPP